MKISKDVFRFGGSDVRFASDEFSSSWNICDEGSSMKLKRSWWKVYASSMLSIDGSIVGKFEAIPWQQVLFSSETNEKIVNNKMIIENIQDVNEIRGVSFRISVILTWFLFFLFSCNASQSSGRIFQDAPTTSFSSRRGGRHVRRLHAAGVHDFRCWHDRLKLFMKTNHARQYSSVLPQIFDGTASEIRCGLWLKLHRSFTCHFYLFDAINKILSNTLR